jgi:ubiquinone/menaquinone biosynthesis C-methylase UbiE
MQRILEPEYMDTPEEASGYAAMDHTAANESFVDAVLAAGVTRGRALDIGTGPGDIPILLARRAKDLAIVAIDAAEHMLVIARQRVAAAGLAARIDVRMADAKRLDFEDSEFDGVFSNTILHHIPEPVRFLREARRVLKPGGRLVIRDLFRPETEAEAMAFVDRYAAGASPYQRKLFFDSFHAALTLDEARLAVRDAGMHGARVAMTSDRHYTVLWSHAGHDASRPGGR